jgi:hypothetical protein
MHDDIDAFAARAPIFAPTVRGVLGGDHRIGAQRERQLISGHERRRERLGLQLEKPAQVGGETPRQDYISPWPSRQRKSRGASASS